MQIDVRLAGQPITIAVGSSAAVAAAAASAAGAATSETNAVAAAAAAATSETNAAASASSASASASNADASEANAAASASGAVGSALAADASADAAAISETNAAASAAAAALAVWEPEGAWLTATVYTVSPRSIVRQNGNAYGCIVAHTSGVFATDLAALKWELLVEKGADGADGAGTGTVTSVDGSGGTTGLTLTGGPITGAGTLTIAGTLAIENGGTNATTAAGARSSLGLDIGSDVQAFAPVLANLAEATAAEIQTGSSTAKFISPSKLFTAAASVALTDAVTIAVDMNTGINFHVTLAGNRTLGNPTNVKPGQSGRIRVTQDGTGTRTLAYGANWKHVGSVPVLSTPAGSVDLFHYFAHDATNIELYYAGELV